MTKENESSRTVSRIIDVLEYVAGKRTGVSISIFASELDIPMSSAHVLIKRLHELEYLRVIDNTKLYTAGSRLNRLAIKAYSIIDIVGISRPFIQALSERTSEDIYLAVVENGSITYADNVEGSNSVRLSIPLGEPRVLHATAMGKLFLANLEKNSLETTLNALQLQKFAPLTITDKEDLISALNIIKEQGHSLSYNEHLEGIAGIAAPIFDAHGAMVGAVGMALPIGRFQKISNSLAVETKITANEISKHLGFTA